MIPASRGCRVVMGGPALTAWTASHGVRTAVVFKSQLLARVETVPDGIHELVEKQQEKWGYIKVGH